MKSKKTIAYCSFLICLVISSYIAFPILSSQSYAETAKGTCASAAEKEAQIRPMIHYTRLPVNVNGDNRYFVFVYIPDNYKNIELKVEGVSTWWIEELKPSIASRSGDNVVAKTSGSFIIHGVPAQSTCSCKPVSPQSPKDVCSSGCINAGVDCQTGCKAGPGLQLTPSDFAVRAFGFENSEDFLTVVGITENQVQGLSDEEISSQIYYLTAAMFGLLDSQFRGTKSQMPFASQVVVEQMVGMDWNNFESSYSIVHSNPKTGSTFFTPTEAFAYIRDYVAPKGTNNEMFAYYLASLKDGKISRIVVTIGKDAKGQLRYAPGFTNTNTQYYLSVDWVSGTHEYYFYRFLKEGFTVIGDLHGHPLSGMPVLDVADVCSVGELANMFKIMAFERQSLKDMIFNKYAKFWRQNPLAFGSTLDYTTGKYSFFGINPEQAGNAYIYGMTRYGADQRFKGVTWAGLAWDQAVNAYGFPGDAVLYGTILSDIPSSSAINNGWVRYFLDSTGLDFFPSVHYLRLKTRGIVMQIQNAKRLGQDTSLLLRDLKVIRIALDELEKIVPTGIDDVRFSETNRVVNYMIKETRGLIDAATGDPIKVHVIEEPKIKEVYTQGMFKVQKSVLENSNSLDKEGIRPSSPAISELGTSLDNYIGTMEKVNQFSNDVAIRKLAESVGAEKDPLKAAKTSGTWGPMIVGIGLALSQSASSDLRAYGERINDANYKLAANVIDALGWGTLGASLTVTATSYLGLTVPAVFVKYLSLGANIEQIVNGFATGSIIGAIVITSYDAAKHIICMYFDPNNPLCTSSCSPDPLYGTLQLELEKNSMQPGEKINFVLYGLQNCERGDLGRVATLKQISQNQYQTDKVIGDCNFKEYGDGVVKMFCCEGQIGKNCQSQSGGCIDIVVDPGNYKIVGEKYTGEEWSHFSSTMQDITVTNQSSTTTTVTGETGCCQGYNACRITTKTNCDPSSYWYGSNYECGDGKTCTSKNVVNETACSKECLNKNYSGGSCRPGNMCYSGETDIQRNGCPLNNKCCCSGGATSTVAGISLDCKKENDKSWLCSSTQGTTTRCVQGTSSSWDCEATSSQTGSMADLNSMFGELGKQMVNILLKFFGLNQYIAVK